MFYRSVLQVKHGYQPKFKACKDKQGKIIEDETEVVNRWTEHFEENYVNTERLSENNKHLTAQPWIEYPTVEEVEDAILKLKNNKDLGEDSITAELIKHGGQIFFKNNT
jgi:hypothetical protein